MKPDDPNVGAVLLELARRSLSEMTAHRMQYEREQYMTGRQAYLKKCPPGFMTRREISMELGIPLRNISFWVKTGKLPHKRIGHNVYFEPNETLEAYKRIDHKRGRKPQ